MPRSHTGEGTMIKFLNVGDYKDQKCAVKENSSPCIVASVHYNAWDLIVKVVPQTGWL